jgi:hypothetical protein
VRRKFDQALGNDPELASYVLTEIKKLYDIEREATQANYTYEQIKELRAEKSYPILKNLESWLLIATQSILPKSPIGNAILYILGISPINTLYP